MATYIDLLKGLSHDAHVRLSALLLKALSCPLRYESGQSSLEYSIVESIWDRVSPYVANAADVRLYEPCVQRMHSLACDEDEARCFDWWTTFWIHVAMKTPEVAADHVDEFFRDAVERKRTVMASLLPVGEIDRHLVFTLLPSSRCCI